MYKVTLMNESLSSNFEVDKKDLIIECWTKRGMFYSDINDIYISYDLSKYCFIEIKEIEEIK